MCCSLEYLSCSYASQTVLERCSMIFGTWSGCPPLLGGVSSRNPATERSKGTPHMSTKHKWMGIGSPFEQVGLTTKSPTYRTTTPSPGCSDGSNGLSRSSELSVLGTNRSNLFLTTALTDRCLNGQSDLQAENQYK